MVAGLGSGDGWGGEMEEEDGWGGANGGGGNGGDEI